MLEFSPLTANDLKALEPYLANSRLIDMGFTSLYSIKDSFSVEYAFFEGALILKMKYGEETAYAHPLGKNAGGEILEALLCEIGEKNVLFDYITEEAKPLYENIKCYSSVFESFDKYSDYFAKKTDFCDKERPGHPRKYTDYRAFLTHNKCETAEICAGNIKDCFYLFDRWCEGRDCSLCAYGCEKKLQSTIFDAWDELPAKGIIAYINGEPQAYLIGEQNGDTALILYGKPVGKQNGLNVFMHITLIDKCFPYAEYVNYSPDPGMDGLRLFKRQFTPFCRIKKYCCRLTNND